jgi:hypothetical protein
VKTDAGIASLSVSCKNFNLWIRLPNYVVEVDLVAVGKVRRYTPDLTMKKPKP